MKVIIAGGRDIHDVVLVERAVTASGFKITEVVSGGASGVDRAGERWARALNIPVRVFRADWAFRGAAAGPIRNRQMAEYADALIAVWDGKSAGTRNMIHEANKRGLRIHIHMLTNQKS